MITRSYRGYRYFTARGPWNTTNGYVIIKPNQKGYHNKHSFTNSSINCHGGITYDSNYYRSLGIPLPKSCRIIGFDTNHAGDYNPIMAKEMKKTPLDPMTKHLYKKHPEMTKLDPRHTFDGPLAHHWTKPELFKQCRHIINQLINDNY